MARPRIFISSTYYDLKYIRSDLDRFVKDQGYESVLNEYGNIPYGNTERLEEYCYKEIDLCDILVAVIGGRFGSEGRDGKYSVSNLELKTAIDKGKQVYIFIDKTVYSEYRTYSVNKDNKKMNYAAVDDSRIYKFIEEVHALPMNNQIQSFESVTDITKYLKEQWAGLFQWLLSESARQREVDLIDGLKNTSNTLKQLVNYLVNEKDKGDQAVKDILFSNHPAFSDLQKKTYIPYRVIFNTLSELDQLLKARGYDLLVEWEHNYKKGHYSWYNKQKECVIYVSELIFDENKKLIPITPSDWNDNWISYSDFSDIPF